jgi:hypothetical protein
MFPCAAFSEQGYEMRSMGCAHHFRPTTQLRTWGTRPISSDVDCDTRSPHWLRSVNLANDPHELVKLAFPGELSSGPDEMRGCGGIA